MSDLITKFNYFNNLNLDPSTGQSIEIDDMNSVSINLGSELRNNSMTVTMKNDPIDVFSDGTIRHRWVDKEGNAIFQAIKAAKGTVIDEEIVDIHAVYTESDPSLDVDSDDYLLFSGVIVKGKIPFKTDRHSITLSCKDRSVIALDKLTIPQAYKPDDTLAPDGTGWRSPTIIQSLLQNATEARQDAPSFDDNGNKALTNKYLIDARLFSDFVVSSGNTTSASTRKLIDSGASFTSDDIDKDDWIRNTTTNQYAYVESIDSSSQITVSNDIFSSGDGYQISDGFIQDLRPDGSEFPTISFAQVDKPIAESIQTLSQVDKLNTPTETDPESGTLVVQRGMRWFIDKKNRFHWYVPSDTPRWVYEVGQTKAISPDTAFHRLFDVKPQNEVDNNINFIIFKAGEDMNGLMIKDYARAKFSGSPNAKDSLRNWLHISRNMKWEDEEAGNIKKDKFDEYAYPGTTGTNSYPVTPAWDRIGTTVASDIEYNTNFKTEAVTRGRERCQAIFQQQANPKWTVKMQVRGEDIIVGDLIDFTSKAHGIKNILIRVNQVTHSITAEQGWITSVTAQEDETTAQVGI